MDYHIRECIKIAIALESKGVNVDYLKQAISAIFYNRNPEPYDTQRLFYTIALLGDSYPECKEQITALQVSAVEIHVGILAGRRSTAF